MPDFALTFRTGASGNEGSNRMYQLAEKAPLKLFVVAFNSNAFIYLMTSGKITTIKP